MPGPPLYGSYSAMGKLRAAHLRPLQGGVIFIFRLTIFLPAFRRIPSGPYCLIQRIGMAADLYQQTAGR